MNDIQLQEKHIYDQLGPLFKSEGYQLNTQKKQFILPTSNGFRKVLISINADGHEQSLDLKLGIRLDLVEELANQFLINQKTDAKETTTLLTSHKSLSSQLSEKLLTGSRADLSETCKLIACFMRSKGFPFLKSVDRLRKLDGILNRKPENPCPYLPNQFNRCFKGIITAKITHRSNLNGLIKRYLQFLQKKNASPEVLTSYKKLVRFMRYYSIN